MDPRADLEPARQWERGRRREAGKLREGKGWGRAGKGREGRSEALWHFHGLNLTPL